MPNNTSYTNTWKSLFEFVSPIKMKDTPASEEKDVYYTFTTEKYRIKAPNTHKKWFGAVFRKVHSSEFIPGSIKLEIISFGPLWAPSEEEKNLPYGDKIWDEIWMDKSYLTIME